MIAHIDVTDPAPQGWIEHEARLISRAGKIAAYCATCPETAKIACGEFGGFATEGREGELFAGFDPLSSCCWPAFGAIMRSHSDDDQTMARMMLLAQTRAALAGNAALSLAEITGALGFSKTGVWHENERWVGGLARGYASLYDIGDQTLQAFVGKIREEARELVRRNWGAVCDSHLILKERRSSARELWFLFKPTVAFPITPLSANASFDAAG